MNTSIKNLLRFTVCLLVVFVMFHLMAVVALAQVSTNTAPDTGSGAALPLDVFTKLKPIEFLLIPAVTVLIQLVRKYVPQIPDSAWPWAAPFIGAILDYAASKAGLWTGNVALGAMFGGLATWFHQLDKNSVNILGKLLPPAPPAPVAPKA